MLAKLRLRHAPPCFYTSFITLVLAHGETMFTSQNRIRQPRHNASQAARDAGASRRAPPAPTVESESDSSDSESEEVDVEETSTVSRYLVLPFEQLLAQFKTTISRPVETQEGTQPLGHVIAKVGTVGLVLCKPMWIWNGVAAVSRAGIKALPYAIWFSLVYNFVNPAPTRPGFIRPSQSSAQRVRGTWTPPASRR